MALRPLNSVGGFSVGEIPANIILANGDITSNNVTVSGNLVISNATASWGVKTDNLYYSNGQPWDLQEAAGLSTYVQYNSSNNFAASANFTYDDSTQVLTVLGNVKSNNANLGNLAQANYFNASSNVNAVNLNLTGNVLVNNFIQSPGGTALVLSPGTIVRSVANIDPYFGGVSLGGGTRWDNVFANIGNFAANIITGNLTVNLDISGNTANFTGNVVTSNLKVNLELAGNTANFTGNINALNANLGNLATANYVNVASNLKVGGVSNLGPIGNVYVTGGTPGQVVSTDGAGNLSFVTIDTYQIQNGNSNVVVAANGNVTVSVAGNSNVLTVTGTGANINGTLGVTGNVTAPNFIGNVIGNISGNIVIPGANTGVVFNDDGNANSTLGFTFDKTSNAVTINGNLTVNNANLGANATVGNLTVNLELSGNTANFTGNLSAGNLITTGAGGNITMTGGDITGVNAISANTANFTGNITAYNANLGNLAIANFVSVGELYNGNSNIRISANSNITLSVNGNANVFTFSNLGANVIGYIDANGIISAGGFLGSNLVSNTGNLSLQALQSGDSFVEIKPYGNGTVDVANFRITSLATPNFASDAATKAYVDSVAQGLDVKDSVHAASNAAIGVSYTYNNGTSGVGATITASAPGALVLDGQTILSGERVLIKNETGAFVNNTTPSAAFNGIYVCTTEGNVTTAFQLTRSVDFDVASEMYGSFMFVETGSSQADTGWVCTNNLANPITVGTTQIIFAQFSGVGTYSGANGILVSGTLITANVDGITTDIQGGNIVVKTSAQLTTPNIGAATGTSVDLTGNVLANNVTANNQMSANNITVGYFANVNDLNANANVVTSNLTVNTALSGNTANFSGNVILPNLTVNLELAGNTANFTGNIKSANANLGNLATANFFTGTLINGTSNVEVVNNGNVNVTAGGNTSLVVASTGANVTGNLGVTGNITTSSNIIIANSSIRANTTTTTAITANQTIATLSVTGITGVEFLVKGIDSAGGKYSVATVQAVTDGTSVDYVTFATATLGGTTGVLAVNVTAGNVALQVTPSSMNSTVWTTQFRTI